MPERARWLRELAVIEIAGPPAWLLLPLVTERETTGARGSRSEGRRHEGSAHAFLGVIDVDHFKRINDFLGHLIGDEVLLLSGQMRGCLRYHDHLFRFGSEEFVALVRCAHPADVSAVVERLRRHVEETAFPRVGRVTVSGRAERDQAR
jgi:diguanylate cyclase (GGDEF)-like protein